ncbi:cyclase family protein [Ferviditalea candida]|uniref:Cyclase family protein n=1 Tax=Ferviditalea candida TaxID=3108399 RepID=A0ABU5ZNQ3_9BACL|nr:cyclase family protein [Paenibacillaceae bacterium T2]
MSELLQAWMSLISRSKVIDLTHKLEENIPLWPTHARFGKILQESYELGDVALHYQISMSEHSGTHMDAPKHFIQDGPAHYGIDRVPLERIMGRAAAIDLSPFPTERLVIVEHIQQWEEEHGRLQKGDIVLIRYGWDRLWKSRAEKDDSYVREWPGLSFEAAKYFVDKGISAVGSDTLAVDASHSDGNPAHYTLLGNEVLIIENLNNIGLLPAFSLFFALPLPIKDGSGSPVRAFAVVPNL